MGTRNMAFSSVDGLRACHAAGGVSVGSGLQAFGVLDRVDVGVVIRAPDREPVAVALHRCGAASARGAVCGRSEAAAPVPGVAPGVSARWRTRARVRRVIGVTEAGTTNSSAKARADAAGPEAFTRASPLIAATTGAAPKLGGAVGRIKRAVLRGRLTRR
jgi:hypothetical protein